MKPKATIVITTPSISLHDAVSNDVWQMQAVLNADGYHCIVYAQLFSPDLKSRLISFDEVMKALNEQSTLWIYHHSVYWPQGDEMLVFAKAKVVLRYHNITPSHFFEDYGDIIAGLATRKGMEQTTKLINSGLVHHYLGASEFNCAELIACGADRLMCSSLAPLHLSDEFAGVPLDDNVVATLPPDILHILFVGRVVANKGHLHLLKVLDRYLEQYGTAVMLHIAGNLQCTPLRYLDEIKKTIAELQLGNHVKFWGSTSFSALHTLYAKSRVFLSMSEHEGFCVPVIEAQAHGLPVVALDRSAVVETQGVNQVNFREADYSKFAAALHYIHTHPDAYEYLRDQGLRNCQRFSLDVLGKGLLSLVQKLTK